MSWLDRLRKPKPVPVPPLVIDEHAAQVKDAVRKNDAAFEELNRAFERLKPLSDMSELIGGK